MILTEKKEKGRRGGRCWPYDTAAQSARNSSEFHEDVRRDQIGKVRGPPALSAHRAPASPVHVRDPTSYRRPLIGYGTTLAPLFGAVSVSQNGETKAA